MIPENLQDRNVRRFKGFTPQQVEKLLAGKGFKPNSREAAEYLGAMAERAEEMLQKVKPMKAYQGASVGGFDDRSKKLFDAAIKRSAGTDPKSPEVQRYLDNVLETRAKTTMVFPGTADPLQGYQEGGNVQRDPLPTTGAQVEQKTQLDTSQANLASAQQELNRLQQQLASTPIEDEGARNAIVEKINKQQPIITSAQSALASASQQFQTVAVPTAAEAVGATVTTPADLITKQPVDKRVEGTGQTIEVTTGKLT